MKHLFYIGSLLLLQIVYSQESGVPFFYSENGIVTEIDTNGIENFHEYRIDNEYLWLGNNGQAQYSLVFDQSRRLDYSASRLLSEIYDYSYKKYNVIVPFTSAKFVQGARLEQYFHLVHSQNFAKKGNFSLEYDKINSDGSYLRQKTNNNKLTGNIWYETPNKKYNVSFFANRNKNTVEQNGGLLNDSLFIIDTVFSTNRKTLQVNLDSAVDLKISNQLSLFQTVSLFDDSDSLGFGLKQSISLNSKFTNSKRYYTDGTSNLDFYENIFLDTTSTNDSIKVNEINQSIVYGLEYTNKNFVLALSPRISYYYTDYRQAGSHIWLNEYALGGDLLFENSKLKLKSDLNLFISGYRQANYNVYNRIDVNLTKNIEWFLSSSIREYSPSLDLQNYSGNHFSWNNNNFLNTRVVHLSTGSEVNKWGLKGSFSYTDVKNPIYFNYIADASQTNDFVQIIQTTLEKELKLKKWRMTPKAVYQYTGGVIAFRLPDLFTSLKVGYKFNAFRKKLAVFSGIKLTYYNSVQLMSYSPSLGQFYLANNQNKIVGNYPFIDFFVNARIKDVRLFFALTHVNEGLTTQRNYFGAVDHPLEDRAFKVGISWNFKK